MDRVELAQRVRAGDSTRQLAAVFGCSQTNVRYWLRRYALQTLPALRQQQGAGECEICGKDAGGRRRICRGCYTKLRRYRCKVAAVKLLGGMCQRCAWSGPLAAYEFHHVRGKKELTIGHVANKAWELIKKELLKCELLCSNCHRIEHSNGDEPKFLAALAKYPGFVTR